MKRNLDIVVDVVADVKADRRITCMDLSTTQRVSYGTMHNILHDELGLLKKSVQWVPKLLSKEKKGASQDLHGLRHRHSPQLHVNIGQHHYYGQDHGVLPNT
jgi:hypothetical protein